MKSLTNTVHLGEEFLRRVVASSPDCLKVLDLQGNLLAMNEGGVKVLEIADLTPHLGTCWTGWWKGEAEQAAQAAVQEALQGGTGRFEAFAHNFGGTPLWWDVTVSPILGADGKPEKLLSVSRDITRRKVAEAELEALRAKNNAATQAERDRLVEVFERSPSFITVLRGPEHVYELANEGYCQLIGRPAQDILQRSVRKVLPELEGQGFFELLDRVYATGEAHVGKDTPVLLQSQPGQPPVEHFVDFLFQPTRAADGIVDGIFVHGVDWTERKRAEAALRAERELLRTVFDQAPDDAILVMDAERTLTAWNPAAERITGWTAAEAIGQTADLIFTPEDRAAGGAKQETDTAAREGKAADERWHLRKDGSRFWGSGTMNALHAPGGQVRGYLKVFRDATARHEETETLAFLRGLTDDLLNHPSPEQIIEIVERRLGEHLRASRVMVTEASEDGQSVTVQQAWTIPGLKDLVGTYHLNDFGSKIAADYAAGRPHIRRDSEHEYPPGAELDNIRAVQAIAAIDVPVRIDGHLRFVLVVHQATARDWTEREVTLVQQVADRMAAEVQRARSEQVLQVKEAASRFLADLSEATRQTADPDAVLGVVVDQLREHLSADRCAYAEVGEDQDTFTIRYDRADAAGSNRSLAGQYRLSGFGQEMLPTLRSGRTVVIADVSTDPLVADARETMSVVGVAAVVNVPLVKAGRLVAVLAVHELQPRRWTADEIALIEAVAERSWAEFERSRNVRALAFERHQLELIFRESPAAMATWRGDDLVFARVNPEYQDCFRGRPLAGLPLLEACPELAGQGFDDLLREVLHTGKPFTGREVLARIQRDKDGPVEDRYFDFTYLQVSDPDGRPWGVYDHSVDVTDRVQNRLALEQSRNDLREALAEREKLLESERAARSEAERTSRMKDEFLATLSHELRTPLNAILGWTQVLRGDPANTEDMEAGLATIERNSRAQTQIIEDLLDMSKIISGKVRLDVQALQLDQIITASVDTMRPAAAAKSIRLQTLIDPEARMISGDPNRLQQVFWNLLSNAIKFTPKDGKVQVVLERVNSHLEVSIADTGEGIASDFLPHVFDRFRQQDASTTRKHGGLGLGLAIVKQLVELHGGSVQAESAGSGKGTTFKVLLPLSVVQPAPDLTNPERRHPQSGTTSLATPVEQLNLAGVKVLVVDDEADARTLVQRLLVDRGATVQLAGSAADALELLQAQRPDVLVSDIGMPEEDGYALIRQVRALSAELGGDTPAVALTAYARSEDRLKVILAGFQMHMAKPVEAAELLALVASLAGRVAAR